MRNKGHKILSYQIPTIVRLLGVLALEPVCLDLNSSSTTYQLLDLGQATKTLCWNYSKCSHLIPLSFLSIGEDYISPSLIDGQEMWWVLANEVLSEKMSVQLGQDWYEWPCYLLPTIVTLKAKRWVGGITNNGTSINLVPKWEYMETNNGHVIIL